MFVGTNEEQRNPLFQGSVVTSMLETHKKPVLLEVNKNYVVNTEDVINTPRHTISVNGSWNSSQSKLFCVVQSNWNVRYFSTTVTSNLSSWTYEQNVTCPDLHITHIDDFIPKLKFSLSCDVHRITCLTETVSSNVVTNEDVFQVNFGDLCLKRYIANCCQDNLAVPNVVHYVIYHNKSIQFYEFVSFISVIRFIRPCAILIHGDALPEGKYWKYILAVSPNIVHVKWIPPTVIFGQETIHKEHAGDFMRIQALLLYGGIYLDTDTVVVKSLEPFRKHKCIMSEQSSGMMSSALIMAEPNATFLQKWMDGYRYHYKVYNYVYNAMIYPVEISKKHPDLIRIVYGKLSRPWSQIGTKIYYTNFNWKYIFGIHLFSRSTNGHIMNEQLIKTNNSTVGSICRHILFGNKELCF